MLENDVLIVGGGPIGMFASTMCGMVGLNTTVIECSDMLGGQCAKVYPDKYIFDVGGHEKILAKDLVTNLYEQMSRFSPKIELNTEVKKIDKNQDHFILNDSWIAKVVLITSGAGTIKPLKPLLDNLQLLEDAGYIQYILSGMDKFYDKIVVVAGGGDSAMDWCLALAEIGAKQIYLLHRGTKLRGNESLQTKVTQLPNIKLLLGYNLHAIQPDKGQIQVNISSELTINADYFIPCYGIRGDKDYLQNLGFSLEMDNLNNILVDPATFESKVSGLYALGEAGKYLNKRNLIAAAFGECVNAAHHARETHFKDRDFVLQHSSFRFK